mmetsp:Transcript_34432/g.33632  ORF Transcript_34432/g.33632 Transcript_34432/m.33632 type:complete len:82 (+) Transcript_34432:267-512(+)
MNLFYVFEHCPYGNLSKFLDKKERLDEELTAIYMSEILLALEELHSHGVMHRDLKPENIMLDRNFHLKLIDFGEAKSDGLE